MDWFHLQLLHWLYGSYKTYRGAAIKITLYNKTPSWTINITSRTYLKENWSFPLHTKGIIFRIHKFLVKTPPPPQVRPSPPCPLSLPIRPAWRTRSFPMEQSTCRTSWIRSIPTIEKYWIPEEISPSGVEEVYSRQRPQNFSVTSMKIFSIEHRTEHPLQHSVSRHCSR